MTPRMDEDGNEISRRLLTFTLEIISLLSGEDYTIVRKTPGDCVTPIIHLQESGGRSQSPITEPPPHPPIHERKKKILELSNKMIELLTGEELGYLEGHKDRYEDFMVKELRPLKSRDGSRRRNPPERCPRPLYPQDRPEEKHNVPESHQGEELTIINVEEEEERMNDGREEIKADVTTGHCVFPIDGSRRKNRPVRRPYPLYSQDRPEEKHNVPESHQGEELIIIKVEEEEKEERIKETREENLADVTTMPHKKRVRIGKTSELSQDLRNLIVAKHTDGIGYKRISKLLKVPVSTVGSIIRKWKEHHFTINRPRTGAPRKISDITVKNIIKRVVEEPMITCGELQKDLESAGTIVSKKTINNALKLHGLYAHSLQKTPLLNKKHI